MNTFRITFILSAFYAMGCLYLVSTPLMAADEKAKAGEKEKADDKKSDDKKADPKDTKSKEKPKSSNLKLTVTVGTVNGEVASVDEKSITIKVPELVANDHPGTKRVTVGRKRITVPTNTVKVTTKDVSYDLADEVKVHKHNKKFSDPEPSISDVQTGDIVTLHLSRESAGAGQKPAEMPRYVTKIDIAAAKK